MCPWVCHPFLPWLPQLGQSLALYKGSAMHLNSTQIFLLRSPTSLPLLNLRISVEQYWLQLPTASSLGHFLTYAPGHGTALVFLLPHWQLLFILLCLFYASMTSKYWTPQVQPLGPPVFYQLSFPPSHSFTFVSTAYILPLGRPLVFSASSKTSHLGV